MAKKNRQLQEGMISSAHGHRSPLSQAAKNGDIEEVRRLLAGREDPNRREALGSTGFASLHWAAVYGHAEIARLLLDAGADTEARSEHEHTPLMVALQKRHVEVLQLLLERGATPHVKDLDVLSQCGE